MIRKTIELSDGRIVVLKSITERERRQFRRFAVKIEKIQSKGSNEDVLSKYEEEMDRSFLKAVDREKTDLFKKDATDAEALEALVELDADDYDKIIEELKTILGINAAHNEELKKK